MGAVDVRDSSIEVLLHELSRTHRVTGAQLVVRRTGGAASAVAGLEDLDSGGAVTARSRFPFGSVTKVLTATVVLQLAADGDLDLDEPVRDHVPELGMASWRAVTARQLLSHSAGVVAGHEVEGRVASLRRYVRSCAREPLVARPGTVFSYSNTGYVVLGRLIEAITGYRWYDAIDSFLAGPLGLGLSYLDRQFGWSSVRAHAVLGQTVTPLDVELPGGWGPAGGVAGSATDLATLAHLLMTGEPDGVLDVDLATDMRTGVPGLQPLDLADGWGLGLALYGGGWLGHDGTLDGASAHLRFHPSRGTIVALTTNASSGTALWEDLWSRLGFATPTAVPSRPHSLPDLRGYLADDYRNGDLRFEVTRNGTGGLRLRDDTGFAAALHPGVEPDVFTVHRADIRSPTQRCRFVRDDAGNVVALQLSGRLATRGGVEAAVWSASS
ncbi:beta-lactamase family protein [Saccharomonospora piscinae]|uniref:serine hydrolase domain-containing protein n=1 Tax=Saccharomonospora piscinae TaxID=687388 RepID=UPI00110654BB|nr:serine hydrolase domain-containing protein [Saccharomonospora piscinae]TLW90599.1 beta-lactamase family protein [Saccharomonospora piscinae]